MMRIYQLPAFKQVFLRLEKTMFIVWLEINGAEIAFKTQTAANRNSAVMQARRAHPDGAVVSVLPA